MMKLYFCSRKGEKKGLYIIAPTLKAAGRKYAHAERVSFRSVTVRVAPIDIDPYELGCIVYPNSIIARMYGIEYTEEERGR